MEVVSTLGVTGGIGSGKSLACRYLSKLGAEVFEADKVARQLMEQQPDIRSAIKQAFGQDSYLQDGRLNSRWLAARVFNRSEELAELNAIVHPAVIEAFDEAKSGCRASVLVQEAELIYEAQLDGRLDAVAVIAAPEAVRMRRVQERDRVSMNLVRQRMLHQLPQEELERRADIVVVNDGNKETLRSKMAIVYELVASDRPVTRDTFRHHRRL